MSVPLSCQIRLARTSGLSGSHTCDEKIRKHPSCMETFHSRPKQTNSACFLYDSIPSQACPKATKKGRISDTRLSAGLCYIVTSKTTHPWRIPGMLWSWNILDYLVEKHYCRDTHEARTTKQQLQGLRDKSQWDSLSLSNGEEKKVTFLSNLKCKFMLFQFGQKQKCTSKHLTSNHDLPPQVPRPYEENLSNASFGQSTDEAAALEIVHL